MYTPQAVTPTTNPLLNTSLTPSHFQPDSIFDWNAQILWSAGSAFPLLWGQITRSWMAGDNTSCSPLIRPPLGMCVCVNVCFSSTYLHTQPCLESYACIPHSQWGIEGRRRTGVNRKVRAKSFFFFSSFYVKLTTSNLQQCKVDFPLLMQKSALLWAYWHCYPFAAPFSCSFWISPQLKGKATKLWQIHPGWREGWSEADREWWGRPSLHQVTRCVKPVSFTWRLKRDNTKTLSAAPTGGLGAPHLGHTHCYTQDVTTFSYNIAVIRSITGIFTTSDSICLKHAATPRFVPGPVSLCLK